MRHICWITALLFVACASPGLQNQHHNASLNAVATGLPDLSGLAWITGDTFLAVHDAKVPFESERPRVSLVRLPDTLSGLSWKPLSVAWPVDSGLSNDLESIARIPGTNRYLLVESGSGGKGLQRVYLAEYESGTVTIEEVVNWPVPVTDVEGAAVTRVGGDPYFVFAERADGEESTDVRWAPLYLDPLRFGAFDGVPLRTIDPTGANARPVSSIEIDAEGRIYTASTYDPNVDTGPFRSVVWEVGRIRTTESGEAGVVLYDTAERLATLDGLKVESIAARDTGVVELIVGTDDESYGAVLRRLPVR